MKKANQRDLSTIPERDWARLAAFIDGEGCISIKSVHGFHAAKSRRVLYVDVAVTNTDLRLTDWLKTTFGGSVYVNNKRANAKWAPAAAWNVASRYASQILEHCLPHFIIKREQAEVALAFQRTVLPGKPYGMKGRPESLVAEQVAFKERLTTLKGTSGGRRGAALSSTIQ